MISTIGSNTFVHDINLFFRDYLRDNLTDPGSRAPVQGVSGVAFVRTHWPERDTDYPVVSVSVNPKSTVPLGLQSTNSIYNMTYEVRVWSKSTRQRDEITDQILSKLMSYRLTAVGSYSLFDLKLTNCFNQDEPGKQGNHNKIIEGTVKFIQVV